MERKGTWEVLRNVLLKAMWVGRATVFCVGLAVILALTVGPAGTALAAKAPTLKLGVQNAVTAATSIAGKVAGPVLRLDNNGTGPDQRSADGRLIWFYRESLVEG